MGCVFLSWNLRSGLRSRRPPSLRSRQTLPEQTAQGARTWQEPVLEGSGLRQIGSVAPSTRAPRAYAVGLAMKSVGKPDAGNPHVRFDERGRETGRLQMAQATAPFLDSTQSTSRSRSHRKAVDERAIAEPEWIEGTVTVISMGSAIGGFTN